MIISPSLSLAPVNGILKKEDTLHLLRRALFGVAHNELKYFAGKDINQCLDILLRPTPSPKEVIEEDSDGIDPLVPRGQTWINAPYESTEVNYRRKLMLKQWWAGRLINRDFSLTEKMTLFWHNHFVTEFDIVKDSRYSYQYIRMLRAHALGNAKKLIREGTTNPAMLVYLNGNANIKGAPNENYGRELLELFTIGKEYGANYTEEDVQAVARVLTGWKDDKDTIKGVFDPSLHDVGDKHFSAYFENKVIKGKEGEAGSEEADELMELLFSRLETAKFICRNLYRWFVHFKIDNDIETHIITPLAQTFIDHSFEIAPVLRTLLSSEHFFDSAFRGCKVKSPVDFLIGVIQQIDLIVHEHEAGALTNLYKCHEPWMQFHIYLEELTMRVGDPPGVSGWIAYYQEPKFDQWWITASSMSLQKKIINGLATTGGIIFNGPYLKFDFPLFVSKFDNPGEVDQFVDNCVDLLLAVQVSQEVKGRLKTTLQPNSPNDINWKQAWTGFAENPDDSKAKLLVNDRLTLFFKKLTGLTEYQMM